MQFLIEVASIDNWEKREGWLFVFDGGIWLSSRWVSLIVVVLGDCVKTSDRCNDVSISLN